VAALPAQNEGEITNAADFNKLEQGLIELRELMKKDVVSNTEAVPLEMDIRHQVDNIYLDINTRLSTEERLAGRQNQEWKTFIEQLGNTLEPYEDVILESAYQPLVEKNRAKRQLKRFTFNADQLINFGGFKKLTQQIVCYFDLV
jgi:hypothetical protein